MEDIKARYVTIKEAISAFGGSEGWYRKVIFKREIQYFKRGGRVVFAVADLEAYFASRVVPVRQPRVFPALHA